MKQNIKTSYMGVKIQKLWLPVGKEGKQYDQAGIHRGFAYIWYTCIIFL